MSAEPEHRDFSIKRIHAFACGARLLAAGAMRYHRLVVEGVPICRAKGRL